VSQSPQLPTGSRSYKEGWRAVNELIRSGGSWSGRERNVAYRSTGNQKFEDVSFVAGLDFDGDGRAFAVFDYDHDGRLDMALTFRTGPRLRLLQNRYDGPSTALQLELRGVKSNPDAVGAWVTLRTNARTLRRHVRSGSGFLSQSSRRLHFGLAPGEAVTSLQIQWPSGLVQSVDRPPANGLYRIPEGGVPAPLSARATPLPVAPEPVEENLWLAEPVPVPLPVPRKGPWTLLSFYGDWCPPCRAELAEWKGKPLPLTVVDVDKSPMAAWNIFRRLLFDYREDLALPTSLLLDSQGRVTKLYRGVTPASVILADLKATSRPTLPFSGVWLSPPGGRNYTEMATAMAEAGLLQEAARYFALARPDPEMRANYAALLLEQGQPGAEPILRDILRTHPNQPDALANLSLLLLNAEKYPEAAALLLRLRSLQPSDAAAAEWLGLARLGEGNLPAALEPLESARALGRESADLLNHLAILYAELGRRQDALALFRYALERFPGHPGLTANRKRLEAAGN
jgi:Flp pilus assembly protein TadD/thiol-disulfide isomerase/thioredoxin